MTHLYKIKSDHRPFSINFESKSVTKVDRSFQFLSSWLSYEGFGEFVFDNWIRKDRMEETVSQFVKAVKEWNGVNFGNIIKKKRRLLERISGIQRCLEKYSSQKLIYL